MNYLKLSIITSVASALVCFGGSALSAKDSKNANPKKPIKENAAVFNKPDQSCDWVSLNHDNYNTRNNPCETTINNTNVANLQQLWSGQLSPTDTVNSGAPVVLNGIVYYGSLDGIVAARNLSDGSLVWQTTVDAPVQSGLLATSDSIYAGTDNLTLYALNPQTGAVQWTQVVDPAAQATGQGSILSGIVIADNVLVVPVVGNAGASPNPQIYGSLNAFNPKNGKSLWRFIPNPPPGGAGCGFWSTPAIDRDLGLLYIGTSNANNSPAGDLSDALLAINYENGKIKWSYQVTRNDDYGYNHPNAPDRDCGASPNLFTVTQPNGKKIDLVGVADKTGVYRAFDRKKGTLVWQTTLTFTPSLFGNASAAYDGNTLYAVATSDPYGLITGPLVIAAGNGDPQAGGQILYYIKATQVTVIKALDPVDGSVKWEISVPQSATPTSLTVANGILYQTDFNGFLRAYDATSGVLLYATQTAPIMIPGFGSINPPIGTAATVVDGKVLFGYGYTIFPGGISCYALPQ